MASSSQWEGAGGEVPGAVVAEANQLYWHSAEGVNGLARRLDLSKGALYEIIEPLPAGLPCPNADGELSYPNRTARERGFVSCAACGFEDEEERVRALLDRPEKAGGTAAADRPGPGRDVAGGLPAWRGGDRGPAADQASAPRSSRALLAAAVGGLAAGLVLGVLLRRR